MNKKHVLLLIGAILCLVGLLKPSWPINSNNNSVNSVNVIEPSDPAVLELANNVISVLKKHNATKDDCYRLSSLYADMEQLILLDGENTVIKTTEEIRQANRLSGLMLKMNLKDRYPDLASSMSKLIISIIGDDQIPLNDELRIKAAEAFGALSWACSQGVK